MSDMNKYKKYVGKYIRNKFGIAKVINIIKHDDYIYLELDRNIVFDINRDTGEISTEFLRRMYPITENAIDLDDRIKDLIDLIEEGDLIQYEGTIYLFIEEVWKTQNNKVVTNEGEEIDFKQVKSILTKEQYQANCYVVERED